MSDERQGSFLARHWPIVLGLGLVLVWALWPRDAEQTSAAGARQQGADAADAADAAETRPTRPADAPGSFGARVPVDSIARAAASVTTAPVAHTDPPAPPALAYQEPPYELPLVGAAPDDPHDQAMHPHPITEAHVRLQKINGLLQNLNDAMSNRDVKAMRALMTELEALDPGDEDNFRRGYGVVADCIESPGRASIAAARSFYDTYRASPLRRFVRRLCFEAGS